MKKPLGVITFIFIAFAVVQTRYTDAQPTLEIYTTKRPELKTISDNALHIERNKLQDLDAIIANFSTTEALQSKTDWRKGFQILNHATLIQLFDRSHLTDCEFVVQHETIKAHSLVLIMASPVFEYALKSSTRFKVSRLKPQELRKIIKFIYSGNVCFRDTEEACAILKYAKGLKLAKAQEAAHSFIFMNMLIYPEQLWKAYECAMTSGDTELAEAALERIAGSASAAIKEPSFSEMPRENLEAFLERDDLAIDSEVEIVDAVSRWGYQSVIKSGKRPSPQLIREHLGPRVIKSIRFLTLSGLEFSRLHFSSSILDYQESMAAALNINTPGGVEMPDTLSSKTNKRARKVQSNDILNQNDIFETVVTESVCGYKQLTISKNNTISVITTYIPTNSTWNLHSIQIPKSIEARSNRNLREGLKVLLYDPNNNIIASVNYDRVPPPVTWRGIYLSSSGNHSVVEDNELILVSFGKTIQVDKRYRITIQFQENRTYPRSINSGDITGDQILSQFVNRINPFDGLYDRVYVTHNQSFIYAFLTP